MKVLLFTVSVLVCILYSLMTGKIFYSYKLTQMHAHSQAACIFIAYLDSVDRSKLQNWLPQALGKWSGPIWWFLAWIPAIAVIVSS